MREGNSVYLDKLVTLWPTHWKHLTNTDMHSTLWTSVSHEVCYSRTFRISISFLILVYSSQMPQKSWVMQQMITATMHLKTKRMFHLCF
jgi:acyl-CoA thioesterase FadM